MAVGAFAAVRDLGVEMPGRFGFVTFDGDSWMTLVDPPITVVHQPAYEVGKAAATFCFGGSRTSTKEIQDPAPTACWRRNSSSAKPDHNEVSIRDQR